MASEKVLWVVNYDHLEEFAKRAMLAKVTAVAIRTDNDLMKAIAIFGAKGIKVYGWRWPSAKRDAAMREADKVASLLAHGLDGYYVDPEGAPGQAYDWDKPGLEQLADDFCAAIRGAAPNKSFGTTSHYRAKKAFPNLPWEVFFKHSTVLLPQAYWRSSEGTIGHGIPEDNYKRSIEFWSQAGGQTAKIVPMAGELGVATSAEIGAYVAAAASHGIGDLHFYTYENSVKDSVWDAVAKA